MSELPATREVRRRIEGIEDESHRNALKFAWLGLCRVSEVVGVAYDSDVGTTARGPTGDSFDITEYVEGALRVPVVVFTVKTSKRGGLPRSVAYPLDPSYEPWAVELCDYFKEFNGDDFVFSFTRQKLWSVARKHFTGLKYPIEEYQRVIEEHEIKDNMRIIDSDGSRYVVKVSRHVNDMGCHAIRHIRAVDLMTIYGFNVQELSTIGGWTLRSMTGASGAISRYVHLDWRSYFPRLLIKRYEL